MKSVDCGTVPECSGRVAPGPRRFRAERHHRPLDAFQLPENLRAPKARIALCPVGIPGSHHIQGYVLILSEKYALIHWCLFCSHFSRCWVHQATFYLLLATVLVEALEQDMPVRSGLLVVV